MPLTKDRSAALAGCTPQDRHPRGRRLLSLLAPQLITGMCVGLGAAGCGNVAASRLTVGVARRTVPSYADYAALSRPGPIGIRIVPASQVSAVRALPSQPLWINESSTNPHVVTPDISSAREVIRSGSARIWISKSRDGGVCVLTFRPELSVGVHPYHAVTASCDTATRAAAGPALFEKARTHSSIWLVAGIAPNGISQVLLTLTDGKIRVVPVHHNAYSTIVPVAVRSVAAVTDKTGHL